MDIFSYIISSKKPSIHCSPQFSASQERARAESLNYTDPINPNYEATNKMYHSVLSECLDRVKRFKDRGDDPRKVNIMVASHNEDTVRFAVQK